MNPTIIQEITLFKEFLAQEQELGIVVGGQGLDTYAASLSLFASLKNAGKNVQIISKKAPTVEVSNLVGIDKVREKFASGDTSKLVVALPYIKGEVEKVLFTEAPNTINFHLTAAEGKSITPFDLNEVKLMWGEGGAPNAIIAVGVGNLDELVGILGTNPQKIVNIDNFSTNTRYGDVVLVDEAFSSLSEISGKIIKELNLPTDIDSAQNILDGVLFATRNFTKPATSPFAFEAASAAMYAGAVRKADEQPRRDTRPEPQSRPQQQPQFQDRGRDPRESRDPRQQQQNRPSQRVNDNDFPAMHMQGGQQNRNQNQNVDNRRFNNQRNNQPSGTSPMGGVQMPQRAAQNFGQNRSQRPTQQQPQPSGAQFGTNPNDIEELMRKIKEENAKRSGGGQNFGQNRAPRQQQDQQRFNSPIDDEEPMRNPQVQDAEIVEDQAVEPQMNAPMEDVAMPQDQNFDNVNPEEIPDDWLMPKVFKSSKNNN